MRATSLAPSIVTLFRQRRRGFAWLALLAICLHLLAAGIGNVHAIKRLETGAGADIFATSICHSAGNAASPQDDEWPALQDGEHCPFCRTASANIALPASTALSFALPDPASFFKPAPGASHPPRAPDLRHAPTRAPPLSFA